MAVSASYVDFFQRKPEISPKTLHHISRAYALVNLKLSGPESVSDSAIAAVVTLAIYQQIHRLPAVGLIHLNGLYQMIQLRGGISRLMKENRALALKPLRYVYMLASAELLFSRFFEAERLTNTRLDAELALQTGLPTLFRSDAVVPMHGVSDDFHFTKDLLPNITSRLSHIMLRVVSFASLLNGGERKGRTKLDPLSYTEMLVSLLYRLIEVAPLGQPRPPLRGPCDDVLHLAMLAFMTTLLPKYCRDDSSSLLSDRLESAIQDLHITSAATHDSAFSLLLWTLFIGGVSIFKCKDHRGLIVETCERLDLHDWPAVRSQLCVFPWVYTLHDMPGQCLWEDAQRRSKKIP